ncbi:MAG: MFS transporter [Desulfopila sp.]|nr:MFS transporter [Desulfopila sp.]
MKKSSPFSISNIRCFIAFRLFFNCRFYYPVFTILFLDYGLTIEQFALLNSVWAATIVAAEVPSGALADLVGRKKLLLATSVLMILEMALLAFVPLESISLVFWAFLLNRVLSGLAEAMASGADEALAYDSLLVQGDKDDWPSVLSMLMRISALGSVLTMSFGALVYDPQIINTILAFSGSTLQVDQQTTMRFPVYLTLLLGLASCATVLLMRETEDTSGSSTQPAQHFRSILRASRLTLQAGKWILQTPFALVIILFAMGYDHVLRMVITMTSRYFRQIQLPEATFGFIGAGMALVGLVVPKLAERMVARFTPQQNAVWLALLSFMALCGIAAFVPYWGLLPMLLVPAGMLLTSFFTSHYLNRITPSHQRATVLSFKGMAFNLAYGLIGLGFATLIASIRKLNSTAYPEMTETLVENASFQTALVWFIPYLAVVLVLTTLLAHFLLRKTTLHHHKG